MKSWSMSKMQNYLLGGVFLIAQLIAIAHLPAHTFESIQAPYGFSGDEQVAQLELCSICLVADYLDDSSVNLARLSLDYSAKSQVLAFAAGALVSTTFDLYLARAPPRFS